MADKKTDKKNIEREYVIPLRKQINKVPRYKRANKAVRAIKEFLVRHMKIYDKDLSKVKVDRYLNEMVWFRGIKKPPMKIKVKAVKDGDIVRVESSELPNKLKFKKLREEKAEKKAKETLEKKKTIMEKAKEGMQKPKVEKQEEGEKKEEEEKKEAVVEAGKEMEKTKAKEIKHTSKVKSPKQEKDARTGYNKSSRGH